APTPNPANDRATVSFELAAPRFVTLSVVDVLGREVLTPVSGVLENGGHTVVLDCSSLNGGTYIVRLQSAQSVITRRFVIVK
ncbi:MAG: T9SS type A sorting domain-containing protein, partial [Candidatus Kapaibacterium sp.]